MEDQELAPIDKSKEVKRQEPEPAPKALERLTVEDQIVSLIPLAGTIELTPDQEEALYSPIVSEDVEIRPDGLIYLPWMEYVTRLRKAFGMSWSLIPYGPPKKIGDFIHWGFWLIVKGKPYAFAVGEQQYMDNGRMTYGDALEGAKSNALMRLCKGLGISLELWKPSFVKEWREKNAETYPAFWPDGKVMIDKNTGKQKMLWRKKGAANKADHDDIQEGMKESHEEKKETPPPPPPPQQDKPQSHRGQVLSVEERMSAKTNKPYFSIKTSSGDTWVGDRSPEIVKMAKDAIKLQAEMVWTLNDKGMLKTLEVARD